MPKSAKGVIAAIVVFSTALFVYQAYVDKLSRSPEEAMNEFFTQEGAEDMLMDPLVLAGKDVVPLVIEDVKNAEMPRRRYAIAFLGNDTYPEAIPVLEKILNDENEKNYFRGDALISIYKLDKEKGKELASSYKNNDDYLGQMSQQVLSNSSYANSKRSFLNALRGWHE